MLRSWLFVRQFSAGRRVFQKVNLFEKLGDKSALLSPSINLRIRDTNKTGETAQVNSEDWQLREEALDGTTVRGVQAGRTVVVHNGDTSTALRRLTRKLVSNAVPMDRKNQKFHMKPGKVAEMKRSRRHRRDFKKGFKRLIEIVKDAKRKGY